MKSSRKLSVALAVLAAAGLASLAPGQPVAAAHDEPSIEGSWLFTVTPPPGGPPPFQALDTFSPRGGWVGQAATAALSNTSVAQGSWRRTRDGIVVTQIAFTRDAAGNPTGTEVVRKRVRFTGPDTLEGESQISFCDLDGNCFSPPGCARLVAQRIRPARPDCAGS
jgi:hypothetical protein